MQQWEFTEAMELDRMVMRWRIDLRLLVRDEMDEMDKMWYTGYAGTVMVDDRV